jgi:hypothetical protein
MVDGCFQQQMTGIMGPGVRRDDECQSRHDECNDTVVDDPALDAVASHRLNHRPFLPKQSRRLMYVWSVYLDATGSPFTVVRDLKEEGVASRLPIAIDRGWLLSHSASPLICVEREQTAFSIWFFVRRDCDAGNIRVRCCKHPTVGTRTAWQTTDDFLSRIFAGMNRAPIISEQDLHIARRVAA